MLLPKQVLAKCSYYKNVDWASFQSIDKWAQETFMQLINLFTVCNTLHIPLSWLEEYNGRHPAQILKMISNIQLGYHPNIELRSTQEILRIIKTPQYKIGRLKRKAWVKILPIVKKILSFFVEIIKITPLYPFNRSNLLLRSINGVLRINNK